MDWRFSTFLLFLAALLTGITWATSDTGLCNSEYVLGVLRDKTKDGALNCFDFWLNRYQTLIGAIIALIAAVFALLPARGQLREMRRQSSATAKQSAIEQAKDLEAEVNAYKNAGSVHYVMLRRLEEYDTESPHQIYQEWPERWQYVINQVFEVNNQVSFYIGRYPTMNDDWTARIQLQAAALELSMCSRDLGSIFRRRTSGADHEFGEEDVTPQEAKEGRAKMDQAIAEFEDARKVVVKKLEKHLEETWRQIRVLEQDALG